MSLPINAGGSNPFGSTTPQPLDESTRTLWNRAIRDPSSLTDQEIRLILHRPPPGQENTLCQNACGLSMDELITKALNSNINNNNNNNNNNNDVIPLSSLGLSRKEASLLTAGVVEGESGRILSEVARLSTEDRDLKERAMRAARSVDVRAAAAREVAQSIQQRWAAVTLAAAEALNDDDIRNIRVVMKVPWQEHVLQTSSTSASGSASGSGLGESESGARFGLVVFYPKEEDEQKGGGRLAEYKFQIGTALHHALHYSATLIKDKTRDRFTLRWVAVPDNSNNNLDSSALRSRFSTMLLNNEIPVGFRRDAFLYVDEEALHSRESTRPYVWLAEPEAPSESKTEPEPEPQPGTGTGAQPKSSQSLKVNIKHIAPTLFARLVQRDLHGEARRKPYRHTSELSRLHAATDARFIDERDGIWPPSARYQ